MASLINFSSISELAGASGTNGRDIFVRRLRREAGTGPFACQHRVECRFNPVYVRMPPRRCSVTGQVRRVAPETAAALPFVQFRNRRLPL